MAPPCDADNEEMAQRLMNDAAKLGIKVSDCARSRRGSESIAVFFSARKKIRESGAGGSRYASVRDCDLKDCHDGIFFFFCFSFSLKCS